MLIAVGLILVRLACLAMFGSTWRVRLGAATVLACFLGGWAFIGMFLITGSPAGSAA